MRYQFDLTIPALTPESSPATLAVNLTAGVLTGALIYFRAGCHNVVYVTISDALYQLVPAHGSPALFGDAQTHAVPLKYTMTGKTHILTLAGWSPTCRYAHTVTIWLDLETDEDAAKLTFQQQMDYLTGSLNKRKK